MRTFQSIIDALVSNDLSVLESYSLKDKILEKDDYVGKIWLRHVIDVADPEVVKWILSDVKVIPLDIKMNDGHTFITACMERTDLNKFKILDLL